MAAKTLYEYLYERDYIFPENNDIASHAWNAATKAAEERFTSTNTQLTSALWHELKRRQSNGLVPLRVDWVAVTEKRLNAAVAALRHS